MKSWHVLTGSGQRVPPSPQGGARRFFWVQALSGEAEVRCMKPAETAPAILSVQIAGSSPRATRLKFHLAEAPAGIRGLYCSAKPLTGTPTRQRVGGLKLTE